VNPEQQIETRKRIFDSAAKLFAERGYSTVSMREIADAAEVSKPMLYYYFESKAGLCRALVEDGIDKMIAEVNRIVTKPVSVEERLRELTRERYRSVRENPEIMRFHNDFFFGPNASGLIHEFSERLEYPLRVLSQLIAEAQAKNEFASDVDPDTLALMYLGVTSVFVHMQIALDRPEFCTKPEIDDRLADTVVSQFINGAKARPAQPIQS
jgi:AcrR family transcriptional regulator